MKVLFFVMFSLFSFAALACEAPPVIGFFCKPEDKSVAIPEQLVTDLSLLVAKLDKALIKSAIEDDPSVVPRIRDGSCYMMTTADFYAESFPKEWKSKQGLICAGAAKEFIASVGSILNPRATAYSHIKKQKEVEKAQKTVTQGSIGSGQVQSLL